MALPVHHAIAAALERQPRRHLLAAWVGAIIAALFILPFGLPSAHADNGDSAFELSGSEVAFGDVLVRTSHTKEITFTNVSDSDQVVDLVINGTLWPMFKFTAPQGGSPECAAGVTVAAGQSCALAFEFTPPVDSAYSQTIDVVFNGVTYPVQLSGRGIGAFEITGNVHDFGEVAFGQTVRHEVLFTNISGVTQVLQMSGGGGLETGYSTNGPVENTPRCWTAVVVNPGESCVSIFEFSPVRLGPHPGGTGGTINGQSYEITLSGTGVATFFYQSSSLDFGEVVVGQTAAREVIFTNVSSATQTLLITGGTADSTVFADSLVGGSEARCESGTDMAPGESCSWPVSFTPDAVQTFHGTVEFNVNGVDFSVSLTGAGTDGLVLSGYMIDFGEVIVDEDAIDQVWITNLSDSPVELNIADGAIAGPDFFDVPVDSDQAPRCENGELLEPLAQCSWPVRFAPTSVGSHSASFPITVNDMERTITVQGEGIHWATLHPTALDFGDVIIGQTATDNLWVTNASSTERTLYFAGGTVDEFGFSNGAETNDQPLCATDQQLAPGESCHWPLFFTPTSEGKFSTWTQVALRPEGGASQTVTLTGTGIVAAPEPDPEETDPAESDPEETDPAEPDPEETDPAEPDPEETDPAESDPDESGPVEPNPVELTPIIPTDPTPSESAPGPEQPGTQEPKETSPKETSPGHGTPGAQLPATGATVTTFAGLALMLLLGGITLRRSNARR